MFRYVWAYQSSGQGEGASYPVQIITARFSTTMPDVRIRNAGAVTRTRRKIPLARLASQQLYIFNER